MGGLDLLTTFEALGVAITLDGDNLRVKAPADVWTPDLRAKLAQHKGELMAALASRGEKLRPLAAENDTRRSSAVATEPDGPPWADPRPELAEDADLWRRLLFAAYIEGHDPDSLFGILNGFRCYGASLRMGKATAILGPGEIDLAEYGQWRGQYLEPHAAELRRLLAELCPGLGPAD